MKLDETATEPAPREDVIDPELPIVDPHHHLWPSGYWIPYDQHAYLRDIERGHRITATVFVECRAAYRPDGDEALRPVGETELVTAVCPAGATPALAAGLVAWADLTRPADAARTIDGHLEAAGGRLRGIRHNVIWHRRPIVKGQDSPPHLLLDDQFQAGIRAVGRRGLSYDVWLFHEQLPELAAAADALPDQLFVLDHLGGPVPDEPNPQARSEIFARWSSLLRHVARRPNIVVKLGGLGMPLHGLGHEELATRPSSTDLAAAWAPYIETAIDAFGPDRSMFESNFPVDKQSGSYDALWNAFKIITASMSAPERSALFAGTARRVYRLDADPTGTAR
ncbi:amidohydrolase family protein [Frankia sp. AgPm24]|uniref:amidohydrolase family protein n=1 Tax=Frankia sp. AgPm24 TaxID=631128 RepID=UPI00200CFCE7|nr:amidohydrolase family protein [Frankia sp. AgPm24]MCK9920710.1 amidohydrolase family protein [Frankia sp. AgPm24]